MSSSSIQNERAARTRLSRSYMKWSTRLVGKKFHLLTVKSIKLTRGGYAQRKCDRTQWVAVCLCDCGTETIRHVNQIWDGSAKTCGCSLTVKGQDHHRWTGAGVITGSFFNCVKNNARQRSLDVSITANDLLQIWESQRGRCYYTGAPLEWNTDDESVKPSVDRLDSSQGYVHGNVVFTSWLVNRIKNDLGSDEWIALCTRVASYSDQRLAQTAGK
jgi:hypothetical protein